MAGGDVARWSDCLFVVIPGIGGSVLQRTDGGRVETVWGGIEQGAGRIVSPSKLNVADDDGVEPIGVIHDWRVLRRFVIVHGYSGLVRTVMNTTGLKVDWGNPREHVADAQVVVFPWDFRKSIESAADRLDEQIQPRLTALGGSPRDRRVVIVAHSMGGLVARAWARRGEQARVCRAIVTLGTPYLGAPKALRLMAHGLTVGPVPVARRLSRVVQSWPSVHELLPVYRMINAGRSEQLRPADLDVGWLNKQATLRALELNATIRKDWESLSDPPQVIPVTGIGRGTWESADLTGGSITFAKGPSGTDVLHGDGTVPRVAAIPRELDNERGLAAQRMSTGTRHGDLVDWCGLAGELTRIVTLRPSGVVLGDLDRRLALDLDSTWTTTDPLPIQARVFDSHPASTRPTDPNEIASVRARAVTNETKGPWTPLHFTGNQWSGELGQLPAGVAYVMVEATTQSGDDPPPVTERIVVVEQDAINEDNEGQDD